MSSLRDKMNKMKSSDEVAKKRGLSLLEKKFCYEFIKDRKVKASAERVGITRQAGHSYLKKKRVLDFIRHLEEKLTLSALDNEPELLKGQRAIWANSNFRDYFDENDRFIGFKNLTRAQASCIKKVNFGHTPDGVIYIKSIELHDADRSNEILARPFGLFEKISIDLSVMEMMEPEDIERLSKKYGWGSDND